MTALEQLADVVLPTTDEEIWRYSRIDELRLADFSPAEHQRHIHGAAESLLTDPATIGGRQGGERFEPMDVFAALATDLAPPLHIVVPRETVVDEPIVITHRIGTAGTLNTARLVIEVEENAEVTIVERYVGLDEGGADATAPSSSPAEERAARALFLPLVQAVAGPGARLRYLAINQLPNDVWSIGSQQGEGQRDASLLVANVALGGYYARTHTDVRAAGPGADTRQVALYFAGGDQMHDFRTIQDHAAPHTASDLLFKGAVQDRSRSVYTGLIKIRENADGTTAYQTNRNLTLSEGAWAESVPNLDINTNDVKCSHASTVGPIDREQRFYLESRGVHPDVAERLVVLGFFDEVLRQLPIGDLAQELRTAVADKLDLGASVRTADSRPSPTHAEPGAKR